MTVTGFRLCAPHIPGIMSRAGYVYILANRKNGTLYIGVTSRLAMRVAEHRAGLGNTFTSRHRVTRLVYFERHNRVTDAIGREKAMKAWQRAWKIALIESVNADWRDLTPELANLPYE